VTLTNPISAPLTMNADPEPMPMLTRSNAQPIEANGITNRHHRPKTSPTSSNVGITDRSVRRDAVLVGAEGLEPPTFAL
jgi:hypothetical protein